MIEITTRLPGNHGNAARAGEFALKNSRRDLTAKVAINALLGDKVFADPFDLAYAFFETWWLCHTPKTRPVP